MGAGIGNTVITSNYDAPFMSNPSSYANSLIVYYPDSPALDEPFRLSGFTLDLDYKCQGVMLHNPDATPVTQARVDHMRLENVYEPRGRPILVFGHVFGVIDNNELEVGNTPAITSYGRNELSWNNLVFDFGSADNIYYEDNIFNIINTPHDGGVGGRYCSRFNTYNNSGGGIYPWFDAHGNQGPGQNWATMGVEIYRNTLYHSYPTSGVRLIDQRGGKAAIFDNTVIAVSSSGAIQVREEFDDALNPPAVSPISGQPQHISDSYYWNNTYRGNLVHAIEGEDCCDAISENSEFFNQDTSFDGTTGIGVGTLANRPSTCTTGVGYWATDQCDWNSENPGPDGCLYRCTGDNWELYYTPYTYPHPLRGENGTPPPPIPGDLNGDRVVDIFDLSIITAHFGKTQDHPQWNATADAVDSNEIDIFDVVFVASRFTA
jgi:hypothetical protein